MKKILAIALAAILTVSAALMLSSCDEKPTEAETTVAVVTAA